MKLSVSNIAWPADLDSDALEMLTSMGVEGIEIAPTRVWPDWVGMTSKEAHRYGTIIQKAGLSIPAFQSILYGLPELKVFKNKSCQQALLDHLKKVFRIASILEVGVLVFGSPKNRDRGELTEEEAFTQAVPLFKSVGKMANANGTWLCIEPNPPHYGSNFITAWNDALRLVREVDTPGFGLHLDTGCILMNNDEPAEAVRACAGMIKHLHISEPFLSDFSSPAVPHEKVASALAEIGYDGWLSIEMRCGTSPLEAIKEAITLVQKIYG